MTPGSSASTRTTARWAREPERTHRWEQGPDSAIIQFFNPHVAGVEIIGKFGRDAIPVIQPSIKEFLESSGRAHLFWNVAEMTSYDTETRDTFVQLFLSHRSQWDGLHVVFRSALIGMTVSAVGLVFLGALKSYRDHDKFLAAFEQALSKSDAPS